MEAGKRDYVPGAEAKFIEWARHLLNFAISNHARWEVPSPTNSIQVPFNEYEAAYNAAQNPNRGKVDVLRKNEAHKSLEKVLRQYAKAYLLYNPAVSDADRSEIGLPVYSEKRTRVSAPTTIPQLFIDTATPRRVVINYKDKWSARRGKPTNVHGIEVRWAILEQPPADLAELAHSSFDTKPPLTLEFAEHERGKRLYLCGRWEIAREGEKGPSGDVEVAIIP